MHEKLLPLLFFVRLFVFLLVGFGLICVFARSKSFRKKIVLIASLTILLTCTPINPSIKNLYVRTYFDLWSSVRIFSFHENFFLLWESFVISIIFVNLCLYENKQVYEYHHLKKTFYHQNTTMIYCWFRMFQVLFFTLNYLHFMYNYLFV